MEPIDLSRLLPPSGRFSGNPYSTPQSARSIVTPISVASALSIDIGDDNFKKPLIKPQGKGYKQEFNTYIIEWNDNLPDPDNPIHWHANKKFYIGVTLLSMTFITLLNGSYLNPSIVDSDSDLKNNHIGLFFSAIFGLGAAISPLLLGPLSEIYGRIWVLRIGLFVFTFFNLMCVFSQTKGIIILLRFIAGFGAGAPLSVTQAIFSDIFTKEERKRFMAINSLSSILAPTAGSIIGGFVGAYSTWRAVYWTTAVITVMHQALSFLVLVETYTPILIERKAEQLRLKLAESGETNFEVATSFDKKEHVYKLGKITTKSLLRSVRLYFTEPILVLLTFHYFIARL
ncbi:major facilitator superfamily domain-containing protein [Phakopsora pachyrhizi]|nr:major facilitator superfamily domain-containing protein [Phakopsora pachyrhizi]